MYSSNKLIITEKNLILSLSLLLRDRNPFNYFIVGLLLTRYKYSLLYNPFFFRARAIEIEGVVNILNFKGN